MAYYYKRRRIMTRIERIEEKGEGMKEEELRRNAVCSCCGKKIGNAGIPSFWTVSVDRWGLDKTRVRFIKGRLKFGDGKGSAPFPSMIVVWGEP
jgi:hypothetical protein